MSQPKDRFTEIKRCLALADQAFVQAGRSEDEIERVRLIDEAESWLLAAERAFARLTDRMNGAAARRAPLHEVRSFRDASARPEEWFPEDRKPQG